MASDDKIGGVPRGLRARIDEILALVETICDEQLDQEYAMLCRRLVAKLARKRPSPVIRGEVAVWAAGALYAIGQNNFLFDPRHAPHLSAEDLSDLTGVPKSTMAAKAKRIRDAVRMRAPMDPAFCRRELLAEHPFAWLIEIDGLIVDARLLPVELQAEARRYGLIPDLALDNAA